MNEDDDKKYQAWVDEQASLRNPHVSRADFKNEDLIAKAFQDAREFQVINGDVSLSDGQAQQFLKEILQQYRKKRSQDVSQRESNSDLLANAFWNASINELEKAGQYSLPLVEGEKFLNTFLAQYEALKQEMPPQTPRSIASQATVQVRQMESNDAPNHPWRDLIDQDKQCEALQASVTQLREKLDSLDKAGSEYAVLSSRLSRTFDSWHEETIKVVEARKALIDSMEMKTNERESQLRDQLEILPEDEIARMCKELISERRTLLTETETLIKHLKHLEDQESTKLKACNEILAAVLAEIRLLQLKTRIRKAPDDNSRTKYAPYEQKRSELEKKKADIKEQREKWLEKLASQEKHIGLRRSALIALRVEQWRSNVTSIGVSPPLSPKSYEGAPLENVITPPPSPTKEGRDLRDLPQEYIGKVFGFTHDSIIVGPLSTRTNDNKKWSVPASAETIAAVMAGLNGENPKVLVKHDGAGFKPENFQFFAGKELKQHEDRQKQKRGSRGSGSP